MPNFLSKKVEVPKYGTYFVRRRSGYAHDRWVATGFEYRQRREKLKAAAGDAFAEDSEEVKQLGLQIYEIAGREQILYSIVDENGKQTFASIEAVKECDEDLLEALATEIIAINKNTPSIEEAIKNSEPSPSESLQ